MGLLTENQYFIFSITFITFVTFVTNGKKRKKKAVFLDGFFSRF